MENQENKENAFRESFSGYEKEPPDQVWENLKKELQKEPKPEKGWGYIRVSSFTKKQSHLMILAALTIVILFLAVVYFTSNDHLTIRGHAYAGEARLCRGTAVLFLVADRAMPLDSVSHYRSAMIDENGYYQFKQVKPGKYLLRIAPVENSEYAKKFLPTWSDHYSDPAGSHVIVVSAEDVSADVHLLIKREVAK